MLVKFSGHIDVKFPSIVSELDSFLLLAKIKGEVVLALLTALPMCMSPPLFKLNGRSPSLKKEI
jgi:hypothetical protein